MPEGTALELKSLDLNLLVGLEALLRERSVTRAATLLGLTQSATSHLLGRLRDRLGDPLLVRVGGAMLPTPRAEQLLPELSHLLRGLERLLQPPEPWVPAQSARTFRLLAPDFLASLLVPLVNGLAREAPRAQVELVLPERGLFRALADGQVDAVVAPLRRSDLEGLEGETLGALRWAVFAREGHPACQDWGARAWSAAQHIRIRTLSDAESPVEVAARAGGIERQVQVFLPQFVLAPPLLARTDLLLTVPRETLVDAAPAYGLVGLEPPIPLPPLPLALYWSARRGHEPPLLWFRALVRAAVRETLLRATALTLQPLRDPSAPG